MSGGRTRVPASCGSRIEINFEVWMKRHAPIDAVNQTGAMAGERLRLVLAWRWKYDNIDRLVRGHLFETETAHRQVRLHPATHP